MAGTRAFNGDEFEHVHASWLILQGETPFRDFFEHHHPLLWYFLLPIVKLWPEGFGVMFAARALMFLFFAGCAWLLVRIGTRLFGPLTGLWSGAIWVSFATVQPSGYEVRPDIVMVFFLLLAFRLALEGRSRPSFLAGLSLSLAFLTLQKAVLFVPALLLIPLLEVCGRRKGAFARIGWTTVGGLGPIALAAGFLVATDSASDWWDWCVRFNRTAPPLAGVWWQRGFIPLLHSFYYVNTFAFVTMAAGVVWIVARGNREQRVLALGGSILLVASLMTVRRWYHQYSVPVFTLPAVVSAVGIVACIGHLRHRWVAGMTVGLLVALLSWQNRPRIWKELGYLQIQHEQQALFRTVLSNTSPEDLVFQGYPTFNVYRRDASLIWFLPFDLGKRAESAGLMAPWSFREMVREKCPAYVSIGSARSYKGVDTSAFGPWLEETGYRYLDHLDVYEREGL